MNERLFEILDANAPSADKITIDNTDVNTFKLYV